MSYVIWYTYTYVEGRNLFCRGWIAQWLRLIFDGGFLPRCFTLHKTHRFVPLPPTSMVLLRLQLYKFLCKRCLWRKAHDVRVGLERCFFCVFVPTHDYIKPTKHLQLPYLLLLPHFAAKKPRPRSRETASHISGCVGECASFSFCVSLVSCFRIFPLAYTGTYCAFRFSSPADHPHISPGQP